jgi:hypothetical protein
MQKLKYPFIVLAFLAFSSVCVAEDGIDPGGSGEGNPDEQTNIPFDGGVGLLVAAGVAYGIRKKYDDRKKENSIEERNSI